MSIVILVRHGRSTANAEAILAGRTPGVHLDERGREQATLLAGVLGDVAHAYTSPMERCRQTAELAGFPDAQPVDGLNECHYGDWAGRSLNALSTLEVWGEIQQHPSKVSFPGGESMLAMQERVVAAVDAIVERHRGHAVALFSHGDPIKAILASALAMPFDEFQRLDVSPGSVSIIDYSSAKPVVRLVGGGPAATMSFVGRGHAVGGSAEA